MPLESAIWFDVASDPPPDRHYWARRPYPGPLSAQAVSTAPLYIATLIAGTMWFAESLRERYRYRPWRYHVQRYNTSPKMHYGGQPEHVGLLQPPPPRNLTAFRVQPPPPRTEAFAALHFAVEFLAGNDALGAGPNNAESSEPDAPGRIARSKLYPRPEYSGVDLGHTPLGEVLDTIGYLATTARRPARREQEYPHPHAYPHYAFLLVDLQTWPAWAQHQPPPSRVLYVTRPNQEPSDRAESYSLIQMWEMNQRPPHQVTPLLGGKAPPHTLPPTLTPMDAEQFVHSLAPARVTWPAPWRPAFNQEPRPWADPVGFAPQDFHQGLPPQAPPPRSWAYHAAQSRATPQGQIPDADDTIMVAWLGPSQAPAFRGHPARLVPTATTRDVWFATLGVEVLMAWDAPGRPAPQNPPVVRQRPDPYSAWTPTGESFGWHVAPEWRVPGHARARAAAVRAAWASVAVAPPPYESGATIIVSGPYYCDAGAVWVAGAEQADVVSG